MKASDVLVPHARLIVAIGAVLGAAAILWLTHTYTFYFDEWSFIIDAPDWTLASYFVPHNEHPSILSRVIYAALLHTVGLRAYWPYMAVLLAAHVANLVLLFELVRRRAGDLIGIAGAALLLFPGAGFEDVLWAFQMAWLASVALGLGALLVLETRRPMWVAAGLLVASLAFSGIGLVFAIAVTVQLFLTPERRRQLMWLVPVGVAALAWFLTFGRFAGHPTPPPTASNIFIAPGYALWGMGGAAAGIIGEGGWFGPPLLLAATVTVAWRWWRHGADPFALGVAAALVGFYFLTGLTRAQLGLMQSGASRYVYIGAMLWLIVLADAARGLPWRGTWRPALIACLFLACFSSTVLLFAFASAKAFQMERAKADLQALDAMRTQSCLDPTGNADLLVMPQVKPPAYYRAIDRYGDPVAGIPIRDRADFEVAVAHLRKADC